MPKGLAGQRRLLLLTSTVGLAISISTAIGAAAGQVESTPQDIFDAMRGSFQPAKAKGVHARYQWDLSGPHGGEWWIKVNDGTYQMGKGRISNPTVTFMEKNGGHIAPSPPGISGERWISQRT